MKGLDDIADQLVGTLLPSGWKIVERRYVEVDGTGGYRSLGFVAINANDERGFLKILDPRPNTDVEDVLTDLSIRLDTFLYEREIVQKCTERRMSRVIRGIEYGQIDIESGNSTTIHYLLFEWADSDIRSQTDIEEKFETSFALGVLHNTATALRQLHWNGIVHQDVRPANVLIQEQIGAKLGDLGHARDREKSRPNGDLNRDSVYAAPERLYGVQATDFEAAKASDLYQLGSMIFFLFTGVGATVHVSKHLSLIHHWTRWSGEYEDVLPMLHSSSEVALRDLAEYLPSSVIDELVVAARQLINPDPDHRGHPINLEGRGPRFGLDRYISLFDRLKRRAEIELRSSLI